MSKGGSDKYRFCGALMYSTVYAILAKFLGWTFQKVWTISLDFCQNNHRSTNDIYQLETMALGQITRACLLQTTLIMFNNFFKNYKFTVTVNWSVKLQKVTEGYTPSHCQQLW